MDSRILLGPGFASGKERRGYMFDGFTDTIGPRLEVKLVPNAGGRTCPYIAYTFFSSRLVCLTLITQKMLASRITCLSRNNFFA